MDIETLIGDHFLSRKNEKELISILNSKNVLVSYFKIKKTSRRERAIRFSILVKNFNDKKQTAYTTIIQPSLDDYFHFKKGVFHEGYTIINEVNNELFYSFGLEVEEKSISKKNDLLIIKNLCFRRWMCFYLSHYRISYDPKIDQNDLYIMFKNKILAN